MWNKKVFAAALLLLPVLSVAQEKNYVETDPTFTTGARVAVGAEVNLIPRTLDLSVSEQLRLGDNFSRFQRSYTTVGLDCKLLPWLKAGLSYSFIENNSTSKGWGMRHRGAFALTESFKVDRWKISFREKVQVTHRSDSVNLYQSPQNVWVLKGRVKAGYNLPHSRFTPYASAEARILMNGVNPDAFEYDSKKGRWSNPDPQYNDVYLNRVRLIGGTTYKMRNRNVLDLYVVADLKYDLDIDFNSDGKQKKTTSGYADYLFLNDSYFVGFGVSYTFKF